jgi:hypothetical protein
MTKTSRPADMSVSAHCKRGFAIDDNRIVTNASWHRPLLAVNYLQIGGTNAKV